jgi:hypothetical protein
MKIKADLHTHLVHDNLKPFHSAGDFFFNKVVNTAQESMDK